MREREEVVELPKPRRRVNLRHGVTVTLVRLIGTDRNFRFRGFGPTTRLLILTGLSIARIWSVSCRSTGGGGGILRRSRRTTESGGAGDDIQQSSDVCDGEFFGVILCKVFFMVFPF